MYIKAKLYLSHTFSFFCTAHVAFLCSVTSAISYIFGYEYIILLLLLETYSSKFSCLQSAEFVVTNFFPMCGMRRLKAVEFNYKL